MSQAPIEPVQDGHVSDGLRVKTHVTRANVAASVLVCALVVGFCIGVWQLRPKQPPIGRPIGAVGKVATYAVPAIPAGEGFTIWRDGRQIGALPSDVASKYQRIELSSNDVDIAGSSAPDLVLYAWTGGAHCCFTQLLIDGQTGRLLGQFELGNGDPMPFIGAKATGLARAVSVTFDDVTAYKFGSYAESPMARIVVAWDGKRFGLDKKRMKAARPDGPPAYFIAEPELGDAIPLDVLDVSGGEDTPASMPKSGSEGSPRGDRAKTYQTWMGGEEARMKATPLKIGDETSFGPMAAFLNERIYKGQGVAGLASVMAAYQETPQDRDLALAYYFEVLAKSRWIGELDKINDGQLAPMIEKLTSPLPTPAASPYTAPKQ